MAKVSLGRIRTVFKGEWVAAAYEVDDVVLYGGSSYLCIAIAASGNNPTDTAFWSQTAGGVEFVGGWDTSITYKVNQMVTFNGSAYIAITIHSGTQPVAAGNAAWILYASGGDIAPQTGNANKVLGTDGTATSWVAADPDQTGNAGKILGTDGTATSWVEGVADQSGQANKVLKSDGTSTSWTNVGVTELGISDGLSGDFLSTDGSGTLSFATPAGGGGISSLVSNDWGINIPQCWELMRDYISSFEIKVNNEYCGAGGANCSWTVPSGVTEAEFNIWGGGGNSNACNGGGCCQFSSGGGNGEYTWVNITVAPGEVYCLCAGGAHAEGGCYTYNQCSGCTSFVCGPNNTCIMSCGGIYGHNMLCGPCSRCHYPTHNHSQATVASSVSMFKTDYDYCSGRHHGTPQFHFGGSEESLGNTCGSKINKSAVVPSMVGATRACGNSICYMCYYVPQIDSNHTICKRTTDWTGYTASGCCGYTCSYHNVPGLGGMSKIGSCYEGPTYGDRGRAGAICVKYK